MVYPKTLVLPLSCLLFILGLAVFSGAAVDAAGKAVRLWLDIVFPSLFPFFVASELLGSTGFIKAAGVLLEPVMRPLFNVPGCGSFALLMGITSGYPVGAKLTANMRESGLLTRVESERLLAFSNNSGPLFIIGAVAVGMYHMPELGVFLLACHILACLSVGILFRFYDMKSKSRTAPGRGCILSGKKHILPGTGRVLQGGRLSGFKRELFSTKGNKRPDIGVIFGDAIKNSIMTLLSIGGFIVMFSVLLALLSGAGVISFASDMIMTVAGRFGIDRDIVVSLLSGFFEITNGTNTVSGATGSTIAVQLTATSMILGWGGLSVHSQVLGIIRKTDINIKPYLAGKFLQGVISAVYTFAGIKIAGELFLKDKPAALFYDTHKLFHWHDSLFLSFEYLAFTLSILTISTALLAFFKVLCSKRSELF